jgi:site-specific DNA recombinase
VTSRKLEQALTLRSSIIAHPRLKSSHSFRWKRRTIPLPRKKPFREAKLRIDCDANGPGPNRLLLELIADAYAARQTVLNAPGLSIDQVAKANGRCRKQLAKLFMVSWLSPRIAESIVDGKQPKGLTCTRLLEANLPADWSEQEVLLGFAA